MAYTFASVFIKSQGLLVMILWCCMSMQAQHGHHHAEMKGEAQPMLLHAQNLMTAMEARGFPLSLEKSKKLQSLHLEREEHLIRSGIEEIFDSLCLVEIEINPESRVKLVKGLAKAELVQGGWTSFLVKINNQSGSTAPLPRPKIWNYRQYFIYWWQGHLSPGDALPRHQVCGGRYF